MSDMASNSGGLRRRGEGEGVKKDKEDMISHEDSDQDSWGQILSQVRTVQGSQGSVSD